MNWFALLRNFHENSRINELARTRAGRVVIWAIASALLTWHHKSPLAPLAIGLIFLAPGFRRPILALASLGAILEYYIDRQQLSLSLSSLAVEHSVAWLKVGVFFALVVCGFYFFYRAARQLHRFPEPLRHHPILFLHSGVVGAFGLMIAFPPLAFLAELVPWLLWRISYLIQYGQRGRAQGTSFSDHLFYLWPIYGGFGLPTGKGLDYLSKHEARDGVAEATSRLAGLKVLFLATGWGLILVQFESLFYQDAAAGAFLGFNFGLPTIRQAIVAGNVTMGTAWVTVILGLFHIVLRFAVISHVIVGIVRLSGFNIFRNMYKPLLAESIIDFWGRINYYFKELMVEFFFYPTFLGLRRVNAQLRLFLAVFAAAFFGNMYYNVLTSYRELSEGAFLSLWEYWSPRLVYCAVLTIGIWISMLRQQAARRRRTSKTMWERVRAIAGVWLFYSVAHVWQIGDDEITWLNRLDFCLSLVGL